MPGDPPSTLGARPAPLTALALALALALGVLTTGRAAAPAPPPPLDWEPARTWVFAVGVTEWKTWKGGRMEKKGRRDQELVATLRARGVPDDRIVFLKDRQATLGAIRAALAAQLARSRPGDWLFFYFQGHGVRDREDKKNQYFFMNYDADDDRDGSYWPMASVVDAVERHFHGSRVFLLADCCHSGGLLDAVKRRGDRLSYACLTSVAGHTSSTGEWTYTDCLIRALKGSALADADADGMVTFAELARYVQGEMAFFEQQRAVSLFTGRFEGRQNLALAKPKAHPDIGKHVEVKDEGKWHKAKVVAVKGGEVKVHWVEYEEDEWVERAQVRDFQPKLLSAGTKVKARSDDDDRWHDATVLRAWNGLHLVHFEQSTVALDEWVGLDRLRQPVEGR